MSDKAILEKHHSMIVAFLEEESVQGRLCDFVPEGSKADSLMCEILQSNYQLQPRDLTIPLKTKRPQITKIKSNLNEHLREFSKKHGIKPNIQLYFQREDGGDVTVDGGYLACSYTEDSNICGRLVSYKRLLSRLSKALTKIKGIGMQEALQIPKSPPSDQSKEILMLNDMVLDVNRSNKNQNLFRFEYCWPEFVGRDEEMQRLYKFIDYKNENLLWWAITGNGGTGKSRLALRLCRKLKEQGWHTGFLRNTNGPEVWREWKPQRPTLIVIDYNHEKTKELGEHIGMKYKESQQWDHPVRILFLGRNEENESLKRFRESHWEIFENNIRYSEINDGKENKSLKLKGLEDKFIDSIIAEVFEHYPDKQASTDEVKAIKSFLKGKGHENRPLYVMFMADACARGENVRGWDIDKLHESVLKHNKNIWKRAGVDETNNLDRKHIILLILATMTNGVEIKDSKYTECLKVTIDGVDVADILPTKREFKGSKYQILCDEKVSEVLSPMAPDILGEYFILQRWKADMSEVCEMELLAKIAWQYKPWGMTDFVSRVAMDFLNDEGLDKIVNMTDICGDHYLERATLLVNLTGYCGKAGDLDKAVKYYDRIEDLWNSGYQSYNGVSIMLANAAVNLISCYCNARDPGKAAQYFNNIVVLWNSGYQKNKEISLRLANTALKLISYYGETEEFDKAAQYYDRIEYLWNSDHQKDKEISVQLVKAACKQAYCCCNVGEPDKAVKYYDRIEDMWNSGYQTHENISACLAYVAVKLTSYYCNAEEPNKAAQYYNRIEDLWNNGYQENEDISVWLASAAFNLAFCYGKTEDPNKAFQYYDRIGNLWNSGYQKNKEISACLAIATCNLIGYYSIAGESNEVVKCYDRIEDLWNSGYQKDERISVELAKAAVKLISYYVETKEFNKTAKYYDRIEDLWDSGYQKNKAISVWLASAAYNLSFFYCKAENPDKAVKYYDRIEDLWNSGYQKDEGISVCLAKAACDLTRLYCVTGESNEAVKYYDRIEDLWNSGYQKDERISVELAKAACDLTCLYCIADKSNEAVKYYERIEDLWNNGCQKNEEISLRLAKATGQLIFYYGETERLDKAAQYYDRIANLWNSHYRKNKEISVQLATAACNLTAHYIIAGEPDKAVKYYDHIEDLWNSGYQKNKEISLWLANAAGNLIYNYEITGEPDKAVKYYDRIEDLWNNGYQKNKEISVRLAQVTCTCSEMFEKKGEASMSAQYKKKFMELYDSFPESQDMATMHTKYFAEDKDK